MAYKELKVTFRMKSYRIRDRQYFSAFWRSRQIYDLAEALKKFLVGQITGLAIL